MGIAGTDRIYLPGRGCADVTFFRSRTIPAAPLSEGDDHRRECASKKDFRRVRRIFSMALAAGFLFVKMKDAAEGEDLFDSVGRNLFQSGTG